MPTLHVSALANDAYVRLPLVSSGTTVTAAGGEQQTAGVVFFDVIDLAVVYLNAVARVIRDRKIEALYVANGGADVATRCFAAGDFDAVGKEQL